MILRLIHIFITLIPRWWHRKGFGVQSPNDFSLVRDVLFESLHYYAYEDQHLTTEMERQFYRIKLWNKEVKVVDSAEEYRKVADDAGDECTAVIEHIATKNGRLWRKIVSDPRARVTFDMGVRGLVLFDKKRIKQNYIL